MGILRLNWKDTFFTTNPDWKSVFFTRGAEDGEIGMWVLVNKVWGLETGEKDAIFIDFFVEEI